MRHRKIREVVIELTALLDVVIILIFAVMIENAKLVQESQNNLDDANTQIESMQEEMQNVKSSNKELKELLSKVTNGSQDALIEEVQQDKEKLKSYEYMNEVVTIVNVSLENKGETRVVAFGRETEPYKKLSVQKGDEKSWNNAVNQLKIYIGESVTQATKENKNLYLLFSADDSKVYVNDFNEIQNVLLAQKDENKKIYYQLREEGNSK